MPRPVDLPAPAHREVARVFVERRDFPVVEVVHATGKFAQPHLLETTTEEVTSQAFEAEVEPDTSTVITPFAAMGRSTQ